MWTGKTFVFLLPYIFCQVTGYCDYLDDDASFRCTGQYEEYVECPDESDAATSLSSARCEPACRCIDGFFRNDDRYCKPYDECPAQKCPDGEHLDTCPTQDCEGLFCPISPSSPMSCPANAECGTPECTCNFNMRRSRLNGTCVPIEDCPAFDCNGPNEEYQPCSPVCPAETCADYINNVTCPPFRIDIAIECQPKCRCKQGFYRNGSGICVAAAQCKDCPAGERWSDCAPVLCDAERCPTSDASPETCAVSKPCVGRCVCGFQRRRDASGTCISATQCPAYQCSRANESYRGCQRCEKCSYIRANGRCSPIAFGVSKIVVKCKPKCYCNEGYYRNDSGVCVLQNECPQFAACKGDPNARSGCGVPCDRTCRLHGKGPISCPKNCIIGGCDCKEGYLLNEDTGKCVLPTQCPTAAVATVSAASKDDFNKFAQSNSDFTIKVFRQMNQKNKNKSFVFSGFPLETILANLNFGAEGETKEQLQTALGIQDDDFSKRVFPTVLTNLQATEGVNLTFASGYFVDEDFKLNAKFKSDSLNIFNAAIENVNFNESSTVDYINSWVAKNTKNQITKLFTHSSFNEFTRFVMCNAIYFKGEWKTQFDVKNTKDRYFHVSNTTVKIPTMYLESHVNYYESQELNAQLIQLFYKGGKASMVIVLPRDINGLDALIDKMTNDILVNGINKMSNRVVQVTLPKWKTETTSDIGSMLREIGIINIFKTSESGLVNVVDTDRPIYVSQVIQKAVIDVNEKGAEAAAATGITVRAPRPGLPPPPPARFTADHPFWYQIQAGDTIIFSGRFVGT